jgi:hypothetical protein
MRQLRRLPLLLLLGLAGVLLAQSLPPPAELDGSVRGPDGPVAGARVRGKGRAASVVTDAAGRFRLPGLFRDADRVTATRDGYRIAGAATGHRPLVLDLLPPPAEDREDYRWVAPEPDPARPQNCGNCHAAIYREWSHSGHARSVDDPHFRTLYDGSDWRGRPGAGWSLLAEHPDGAGVCTACHAPAVSFDDPGYFDLRRAEGTPARGVHCDYCHKVADTTGTVGLTHGRFGLTLLRPAEGQLFFGPLDDVDRGEDVYAPLYRQSRYCASCHEGTVFGVHVYGTYTEWLESPARRQGKQCQDCHMTPTGTLTNIAPGHGGIPRDPRTLADHRLLPGGRPAMLRQCLHVSGRLERTGGEARAVVEVRADNVGHRVPTGFADRHLVLVVDGLTADGREVPARVAPLLPPVAGKDLAGRAGRLYAKVLRDFEGHSPAPFWRADPDVTDTRLLPGRTDRVDVTFPPEVERVRVRLLYRRSWPEVAETKGWPDNEILVVERQGAGKILEPFTAVEATCPLPPPTRVTSPDPRPRAGWPAAPRSGILGADRDRSGGRPCCGSGSNASAPARR